MKKQPRSAKTAAQALALKINRQLAAIDKQTRALVKRTQKKDDWTAVMDLQSLTYRIGVLL